MKINKTMLGACMMALASSVFAAEGGGDRGPNNQVGPQSPSDTPPGNSVPMNSRQSALDNYKMSMDNCRSMTGNTRAQCRRDARNARDVALRDGNTGPTVMVEGVPRPAPGTTPADVGDARMSRSPAQKDGATKP